MLTHDLEVSKNGYNYRMSNNSFTNQTVQVIGFDVETPEIEYDYETNDRLSGRVFLGSRQLVRKATLTLYYEVSKMAQAVHLKNNLAKLLSGFCKYRDMRAINTDIKFQNFMEPDQQFDLDYVSGKQIELTLAAPISFDANQTSGTIEIELESGENPYYESIGRSLDLEKGDKLGLWSSDMEVMFPINSPQRRYTFKNIKQGDVFYHGDVPISQFNQDCKVTITLAKATDNFTWYTEYGEEMVIKGLKLKAGDVLKYDGIQVFRNNIPINEYARGVAQPHFEYGFNQFRFNDVVSKVVFDMKFYYE